MKKYKIIQLAGQSFFSFMAVMAASSAHTAAIKNAEPQNLTVYMEQLLGDGDYRNFKDVRELNRVSSWIREQMRLFGIPCQYQNYKVNDEAYRNVVCSLKTAHAGKVIVGAHYDVFEQSPGADDNASGVSAVLQIARAFLASGQQPERNVIFAFWDGEEKGLLGSKYFVQTCPFVSQIKGYLNFDMIGRNNKPEQPKHVVYFYTAAHPSFGDWLKKDIKKYGLQLEPDYRAWDNPVGGSDNGTFAKAGIPIIWYHTDGHPDYHQPSDHADRLNWDKIVEITKASFLNMWKMANEASW